MVRVAPRVSVVIQHGVLSTVTYDGLRGMSFEVGLKCRPSWN